MFTVSGDGGYFGFKMLDGVVVSLLGDFGGREFIMVFVGMFVTILVMMFVF